MADQPDPPCHGITSAVLVPRYRCPPHMLFLDRLTIFDGLNLNQSRRRMHRAHSDNSPTNGTSHGSGVYPAQHHTAGPHGHVLVLTATLVPPRKRVYSTHVNPLVLLSSARSAAGPRIQLCGHRCVFQRNSQTFDRSMTTVHLCSHRKKKV